MAQRYTSRQDPYHNRGRDQMRKKGGPEFECLWFYMYVLQIVVCPFVYFLLVIVLSVLLRYTDSDYPFDIFWSLCCLYFFDIRILITPLISSNSSSTLKNSQFTLLILLFYVSKIFRNRRGRDRTVVGFTTTSAICAYHH